MTKRHIRLAAAALVMALTAACSSGEDTGTGTTDSSTPGNERITLRIPAGTQSGGYPQPYAAIRGPGRLITTYIFDTLAFPDVTGTPKPWLAKSWTSSPDGKTWTFNLNENVKFHDGMPLTSEDVVFTFNYNLTGPGTGVAQGVTYIDTVTAPDPKTVVIQLKTVRPSFLQDIAGTFGFAIMPKHIWSNVTDPAKFQGPTALIGSGPYKLENFDLTTNSFNFVANEDFYLGPAKVRQFQVVPVADALLALDRGEVDAASGGNALIPRIQYDALAKKYKVLTAPGEYNLALFFNPNKGFPYNEKAFRQGVVYGIDRKDMVKRLVDGRGIPGPAGALGPGNEFLNRDLPTYDYDKAKAAALFDQIGLRDRNNDGMRDKPDGSSFKVPLSVSSSDNQEAQLTKEYLRAVGIDVEINAVDQQTSDDRGAKGDYEMAIQHFGGLSGDPSGLITRFTSNSRSTSFTRVHGYNNPEFDRVANEQAVENDLNKRKELVNRMQAILAEDLPQISLYVPDQVAFVDDKKFKGFAYTPGCPPCGVTGNKRHLHSGNANPAPSN
ncbi:MAG TPA: ABC transporter substrate-binding protein [Acidimicrobiales bacterium]|nr:ABC transporter substrate-binding protein [Acidimicrobiales bacterium]